MSYFTVVFFVTVPVVSPSSLIVLAAALLNFVTAIVALSTQLREKPHRR